MRIEEPSGVFTADIMDFWRPNYLTTALVDGKKSVSAYLQAMDGAWKDYAEQGGRPLGEFAAFCYHQPFTKMAYKAHRHMLETCGQEVDEDEVVRAVGQTTTYNEAVGNSYTASVYLGLAALLDNAVDLTGQAIGLLSYGSGSVAEFFAGVPVPGYRSHLRSEQHGWPGCSNTSGSTSRGRTYRSAAHRTATHRTAPHSSCAASGADGAPWRRRHAAVVRSAPVRDLSTGVSRFGRTRDLRDMTNNHEAARIPSDPSSTSPSGGVDASRITLRSPAELADALPYMLGFHPSDSLVMVAVHGEAGRFGGRLRVGIPAAPEEWEDTARQVADCLIRGSVQRGARPDGIIVFLCQDPHHGDSAQRVMTRLRPLAQRIRLACGALDVPVLEALCLSAGRYWSYWRDMPLTWEDDYAASARGTLRPLVT